MNALPEFLLAKWGAPELHLASFVINAPLEVGAGTRGLETKVRTGREECGCEVVPLLVSETVSPSHRRSAPSDPLRWT